jgi:hypothetical protein
MAEGPVIAGPFLFDDDSKDCLGLRPAVSRQVTCRRFIFVLFRNDFGPRSAVC